MFYKRVLLVLFTLLLTGCAASSVQRDYSFSSKPDEGVVIVSVSFDQSGSRNFQGIFYMDQGTDGLGPFGIQLRTLRENPLMRFGSEFKDSYGQVLALALPAGKHMINTWRFSHTPLYTIRPINKPAPLEFQVVAGTVQYLGNLHFSLEKSKILFGLSVVSDAYPEVRDQRVRDIAMIEKKYPQFKDQISMQLLPQGPWFSNGGTQTENQPIIIPKTSLK